MGSASLQQPQVPRGGLKRQKPTACFRTALLRAVFLISGWSLLGLDWGLKTRAENTYPAQDGPCSSLPGVPVSRKSSFTSSLPPNMTLPGAQLHLARLKTVLDPEKTSLDSLSRTEGAGTSSAELQGGCTPPPGAVETTSKWKTDEPIKEKVIYIMESFRASRDLKRFITWGTRLTILEFSLTNGTDVFYGK